MSGGYGTGGYGEGGYGGDTGLPVLDLPPDQANYTAMQGDSFVSTKLDGGASRFRADQLGTAIVLTLQWTCNRRNYDWLMAFFRTAINHGADPFLIKLILDNGDLQSYTAHILPSTFGLTQQMGQAYVVAASIEVLPDDSYTIGDGDILAAGPEGVGL